MRKKPLILLITSALDVAFNFDKMECIEMISNLINGDCLVELKKLKSNTLDSLVTDPPAGISFMGKNWDSDKGGRNEWINWMESVMRECFRVLKPGAHGLVWAIPRTSHWTAMALEYAGFEIRDVITHLFGSGFPKSLDISKAIDKAAGAERENTGVLMPGHSEGRNRTYGKNGEIYGDVKEAKAYVTLPASAESKLWQGFGTALKPASEHWILVRKPLSEKTVAANVLKHGTGGINIDASRIGTTDKVSGGAKMASSGNTTNAFQDYEPGPHKINTQGRFPANLVLSHNDDCVEVGTKKVKGDSGSVVKSGLTKTEARSWKNSSIGGINRTRYSSEDGTETVSDFSCTPGCAVAELDRQSGVSGGDKRTKKKHVGNVGNGHTHGNMGPAIEGSPCYQDSGGASRFFYCAKASKSEKNAGCEGLADLGEGLDPNAPALDKNHHPTVKPLKLMSYLITMITPPKGVVLDPFMGSGSTGVAAVTNGFKFVGIEKEKEYLAIAKKRIFNSLPEFKKQYKK